MLTTSPGLRREMHCGYIPSEEHVEGQRFQPPDGTKLQLCPGFTTAMPDVFDIARHVADYELGTMDHVCPAGIPKPFLDGVKILRNARDGRVAYRMREKKRKREGGDGV